MIGALDGGVPISHVDLKERQVALSNLKNDNVTLLILRNDHVVCQYLFKTRMSLSPKKAHVAVSILGVKGHVIISGWEAVFQNGKPQDHSLLLEDPR